VLVPNEFEKLCQWFHQDWHLTNPSPEHMVRSALATLSEKERIVVRSFLDELLSGRHDVEELQRIWWETPADIYFPGGDIVKFLQFVRTSIEKDSLSD
jgi:hypothetical protein